MPRERADHPAAQAWFRFRPEAPPPSRIETLKRREDGGVYRLVGSGPAASNVVAKRSPRLKAMVERTVLEEVLPQLALPRPRLHGFSDDGSGSSWLFLEDVGAEHYSPPNEDHRELAVRWLAKMHLAAAELDLEGRLPARGLDHLRDHLKRASRAAVTARRELPRAGAHDGLLARIASLCATMEGDWSALERFVRTVPRTLVHGDCLAKNVHVRATDAGPALAFLDWAGAGWGLAGTDLGLLGLPRSPRSTGEREIALYLDLVGSSWPHLDADRVRGLARLGQAGWAAKVIALEIGFIGRSWARIDDIMGRLEVYASVLEHGQRSPAWHRTSGRSPR